MVWDLIRDSTFGHLVRLASKGRIFSYAEERDTSLWKKFVNEEKSGYIAHHGDTSPPSDYSKEELRGVRTGDDDYAYPSAHADLPEERYNEASDVRIDSEKGKDLHVIDWYGPDDPDNPRNWSTTKKFFVTFEIVFLTFSVYIGSAIYSAGIIGVQQTFGVSQVAATLGLTLYVAGYGLGPMVWAPMSEVPYIGRNPIYISTLSTGGATIADMYRPQKQAYGLCVWGIGAVCGPVLGPLVGGFAAEAKGWTWTIWEIMWLSGFCWVFLFFFLPETSSTNILYRRTRRLHIAMMTLVRPITLNFTEPMVFLLKLYIALVYGLLYIWFESFPIVFIEIYGFTLGQQGLAFLGLLVGALITLVCLFSWLYFYQEKQFNENGEIEPEKRLQPAMVGAFFVPICLFWFGWSARSDIHWIMPIIGSSFFSVAAFLLFQAVLPYLSDAYPEYLASVFAGNDLFRSSFGAGNLGVNWASSTLAFLGIVFIPIPFVLYSYGARLRKMSRHAKKDF
ncbi:multidrug resistance protein-like protein [Trematosphaeria pertusa]|uniref:Multidrug resistance protein-like protein n=1 Tax=Trematosphaeria pertusa TaxID=390896 RepID=A0A6A6J1R0_9PLEO|nr:multidrug resistance protein-like protein [Trematosphaeria pertusa]KAF2255830.1 multidrug resistance protein-like protein [Trematosphaeria pertusa]